MRWAGFVNCVLALATAAGVSAIGSSAYSEPDLAGVWTGSVVQIPESKSSYSVVLTFAPNSAESNYPELNCGGKLTRVGASGDYVFFTETITHGRYDPAKRKGCIDGTVTVARTGSQLGWAWFGSFQGKAFFAYATASRK